MGPQALIILDAAIKFGPVIGEAVRNMLKGGEPTDEEWDTLFALMKEQRSKSYFDMVPSSKLPRD